MACNRVQVCNPADAVQIVVHCRLIVLLGGFLIFFILFSAVHAIFKVCLTIKKTCGQVSGKRLHVCMISSLSIEKEGKNKPGAKMGPVELGFKVKCSILHFLWPYTWSGHSGLRHLSNGLLCWVILV